MGRHVQRFLIGLATLAAAIGLAVAVSWVGSYFVHAVLPPRAIGWLRNGVAVVFIGWILIMLGRGIYEAGGLWEKPNG